MNLFERLNLVIRAAFNDLFSEDAPAGGVSGRSPEPTAGAGGPLETRLAQAQASLDALWVNLAQAEARQRQADLEWRAAQAQLQALDAGVDEALQAGQEDLARQRLEELQRWQAQVAELERRSQAYAREAGDLRKEVETLQSGLDEARRKARLLAERERSAEGLEQSVLLQRELGRQLEHLAEDIRRGEEQAARRQDRAEVLRELEQKR